MDFCKVDVNYGTPVLDLMSISSKVPLLKRKTKVQFFGEKHEINCKAMLDGGAVCSFVQSTVLAKETRIKVNNFLNNESDENQSRIHRWYRLKKLGLRWWWCRGFGS